MKKIKMERWEWIYGSIYFIIFGIWAGLIIGGSSSWIARHSHRDDLIINMTVILALLAILYILIRIAIDISRKLNILKKRKAE